MEQHKPSLTENAHPAPPQRVGRIAAWACLRMLWFALVQLAACGGGDSPPPALPSHELVFATQRADGTHRLVRSAADGSTAPSELAGGIAGSAPRPRPDGRLLVYTASAPAPRPSSPLRLLDLQGGQTSVLSTQTGDLAREPAFAPDGRRMAYVAGSDDPEGADAIYAATLDGTRLVDIVNLTPRASAGPGSNVTPAWSPDGRQIAFASTRGTGSWLLWLMNADGSGVRQLTTAPAGGTFVADHHPSWSPDGKQIAFQRQSDGRKRVGILSLSGAGGLGFFEFDGQAGAPAWSPDGRRIAFVGDLDGELDIFVWPVDKAGPVLRIRHPGPDFSPAWLLRTLR